MSLQKFIHENKAFPENQLKQKHQNLWATTGGRAEDYNPIASDWLRGLHHTGTPNTSEYPKHRRRPRTPLHHNPGTKDSLIKVPAITSHGGHHKIKGHAQNRKPYMGHQTFQLLTLNITIL